MIAAGLIVLYVLGVMLGVFLLGTGTLNGDDHGMIVMIWPVALVLAVAVVPFVGVYKLGRRWRKNQRPRYHDEGW